MKFLQINSVCGIRSTGRIVTEAADKLIAEGHECRIAYGREQVPEKYRAISYRIGTDLTVKRNAAMARIFDNDGFCAKKETAEFLKWAEEYDPDVLWLHNLHGYYINVDMLFKWIKKRPQMEVRWTLHDCWTFTGHCCHFTCAGCYKWKQECRKCVQKKKYPKSLLIDNSKRNYYKKMECFLGVKNMTLITPSFWLKNHVNQSFLKAYNVNVVGNTINKDIFKPTPSDFRERHGLNDKKIILGVATAWGKSKGLYDFVELSRMLDDSYKVVLVGVTESLQKKLPEQILMFDRTNNTTELAEIYTAADVFVNPSREETFGLTTVEALACGTTAIVYKDTACEEIALEYGGIVVEQSCQAIKEVIEKI